MAMDQCIIFHHALCQHASLLYNQHKSYGTYVLCKEGWGKFQNDYMDKILSYFQVCELGKIIVNFAPNHQFILDTWCEQCIECIIYISHLINKWLHMKT